MQKTQNVIRPSLIGHAVLSHSPPKQVDDRMATESYAFDQAHEHPHIRQHRRLPQARLAQHHFVQPQFGLRRRFVRPLLLERGWLASNLLLLRAVDGTCTTVAAVIKAFLLPFAGYRLIVGGAPFAGTLPAMMLPAAERTTQVRATCAAGIREKPNPAVRAVSDATLQPRMGL